MSRHLPNAPLHCDPHMVEVTVDVECNLSVSCVCLCVVYRNETKMLFSKCSVDAWPLDGERDRATVLICVYLYKLFLQFCHNKLKSLILKKHKVQERISRDFLNDQIHKAVLLVKVIVLF